MAPAAAGTGTGTGTGFSAPGGDQDWNMAPASTTTHDWAEDGGDWGSTEPKVRKLLCCYYTDSPFTDMHTCSICFCLLQATAGKW